MSGAGTKENLLRHNGTRPGDGLCHGAGSRADEIVHSGTIDVPMYELLLTAGVVVADVSTSNCNVFKYRHLGEDIGFDETMRMRNELDNAIRIIAAKPVNDSPVYESLKDLNPPMRTMVEKMTAAAAAATGNQSTVSTLMAEADAAFKSGDCEEANCSRRTRPIRKRSGFAARFTPMERVSM